MLLLVPVVALVGTISFLVVSSNGTAKVVYVAWLALAAVLHLGVGGRVAGTTGFVLEALLGIALALHHRFNRWG